MMAYLYLSLPTGHHPTVRIISVWQLQIQHQLTSKHPPPALLPPTPGADLAPHDAELASLDLLLGLKNCTSAHRSITHAIRGTGIFTYMNGKQFMVNIPWMICYGKFLKTMHLFTEENRILHLFKILRWLYGWRGGLDMAWYRITVLRMQRISYTSLNFSISKTCSHSYC